MELGVGLGAIPFDVGRMSFAIVFPVIRFFDSPVLLCFSVISQVDFLPVFLTEAFLLTFACFATTGFLAGTQPKESPQSHFKLKKDKKNTNPTKNTFSNKNKSLKPLLLTETCFFKIFSRLFSNLFQLKSIGIMEK